jgi:hypothetical protein
MKAAACARFAVAFEYERVRTLSLSLRGLSPRANYNDRAAAAGRRS